MRSTKLLMSMLFLSLAFALPATMAAQTGKTALQGGIAWYNACDNNQSIVNAPGDTEVNYQQNGSSATVHVLFHNSTTDASYQLNLEANQSYNAVASSYDLPFHSVWVGLGGNFTMNGTLRITVDASGTPTTSNILMDADHPVTTACSQ
ncbi:MAG TPA: hypothetical protein VJT08_21035 [Terriglobales bacterium]|nr:hypothetical protein [Terriglobales bacterium]